MRAAGHNVPELSRFFGIIIAMYYSDHSPPHFHAKYGDDSASIRIDNGAVVDGNLGRRAVCSGQDRSGAGNSYVAQRGRLGTRVSVRAGIP